MRFSRKFQQQKSKLLCTKSGIFLSKMCSWDERICYWGPWDDCTGSSILDCDGNSPSHPEYIGDQGIFGNDECGICKGEGAIYGNDNCCERDVDRCNTCFGENTTGVADPNGVPMSNDNI